MLPRRPVVLFTAAIAALAIACGGETLEGVGSSSTSNDARDAAADHRVTDATADRSADAIVDTGPVSPVTVDCLKFCNLAESTSPSCDALIANASGHITCSAWCAEGSDAQYTTCASQAIAYWLCVASPGNFLGCDGGDGFEFPACAAERNAVGACLQP